MRLPTRQPIAGGRSRRVTSRDRVVPSLLNRWRVLGALLAVSAAALLGWLVTSHRFDLDPGRVEVTSLVYTPPDAIREAITLPANATPNVFRIDTDRMERALASLPAVAGADVFVTLPDRLVITVIERTPTFVLATLRGAFVVDVDGYILDELPVEDATGLGLPVVTDLREDFAPDADIGGRLDEISLDADLRLAAITPAMIGTRFGSLAVSADDADGFVLTAEPDGWRAIFGHYTPNLRPIDIIDRQVQCLRAALSAGEDDLAVIYLAPLDERCGTYLPRATPSDAPMGSPSESASPS